MKITFSPRRSEARLILCRSGDVLTINGDVFDLSGIPEGATLPQKAVACNALVSDITREQGELHLTLVLPHGANAPEETTFPAVIDVFEDGPVAVPPYDAPSKGDAE